MVPADEVRETLQQITVEPVAGEAPAAAPAPSCSSDWVSLSVFVEWWFDTATRLTQSSAADWGGQVNCAGMAYISATSDLWFRFDEVAVGSINTCGRIGAPSGSCGSVPTSGDWACAGVGNCNGSYYASIGLRVDLPAGWGWGTPPPGCSVEFGGTTLLCVFDTETVHVPPRN